MGIEDVRGYLEGGVAAWRKAGLPVLATPQISVLELSQKLRSLETAPQTVTYSMFAAKANGKRATLPKPSGGRSIRFRKGCRRSTEHGTVAVHCKSGYRSMIACSLLERAGHRNVVNVTGGFDAWQAAGLPVATSRCRRWLTVARLSCHLSAVSTTLEASSNKARGQGSFDAETRSITRAARIDHRCV